MAKNELLVLYHQTARTLQIEQAKQLANDHPRGMAQELVYPITSLPEETAIAVVGGDGSVRSVTNEMLKLHAPGPLLVVAGGSQNGFYRSLTLEGTIRTPDQIQEGDLQAIPHFHSGELNEQIFTHVAEIGNIAGKFSRRNEGLRGSWIPRDLRMFVALLALTMRDLKEYPEDPLVRIIATGNMLGSVKIFSKQSLYSEHLTMVTLPPLKQSEVLPRAGLLFLKLKLKKPIPASWVQVSRANEFSIADSTSPYVYLGGDTHLLAPHEQIHVRRTTKPLQAAAVVFPEKK